MNTLYKTEISDVRWMAYDIPGNVGWMAYLVCVFRALREKRDAYNFASAFPGVLMLIGVGELISERIAGLDRILSGKRNMMSAITARTSKRISMRWNQARFPLPDA